jgi:hypothetical protein
MSSSVEVARQEWEDSHRRVEAESGDRARYRRLLAQVEIVTVELRRRVGQTFTLAQLAAEYSAADEWAREALLDGDPAAGAAASAALVQGAAFHLYARGAVDYSP